MNLADLKAPFAPNKISWRIGSTNGDKTKGMALAYIDARDVQDRLESVCGPNWQCRYVPMHDKKTVCEIGIRIPRPVGNEDYTNASEHEWVWRSDGAGDSDIEAAKGALSDAFKRAAVRWGIGRYLYDLDSPWVAITAAGRSFKIAEHEYKRLEALLSGNAKPSQASAIHTPHTMQSEPKPQGDQHPSATIYAPTETATKAAAAKTWVLGEIPRIKTMDKASLDKFCERFRKARIDLAVLDTKASVELKKALADRLEALFA